MKRKMGFQTMKAADLRIYISRRLVGTMVPIDIRLVSLVDNT